MTPIVGVIRAVLDFDGDDEQVTETGNLWVDYAEGEIVTGTVVLYTVDLHRLRGMLAAARQGATDEDILLALDAAALEEPADGED